MTSSEIRQQFLTFFEGKGHKIVPSAPIVVKNDPTLMFTNAGMNQFKDIFLGEGKPVHPRVADTQRCLRVSGKHNDLEEVGIDTYHHTMFEMLGNWSFGDYFKKEAIAWSWELLTEIYKIDKDRLYVTVFGGDAADDLPEDTEAFMYWKKLVPEDRILFGNKKDNFWEMGDTGPCGPCSEIHVDCRSAEERRLVDGQTLVNADHPQVIEIWNNVFIQFSRQKDGSLKPLPAKHVDTGMGFERLVRVIQGKMSNYDTDVFQPLIGTIAEQAGVIYGSDEQTDIAMRVMADHIRAIAFAIADGQLPSNNKAGYVIRRILRRAVRYAYTFLNFKEPFINKLVPLLAEQFRGVFNELYEQQDFVQKVVLEEETAFLRTLVAGVQRFEQYTIAGASAIDGHFAFELYDTFGFPIDLTALLARERGLTVDMEGFDRQLEQQKARSRAAASTDTGDWVVLREEEGTAFVGYDRLETETAVIKYRNIRQKDKEQYQLVLSVTPFYAESGGQAGDKGVLIDQVTGEKLEVTDTRKENELIVHFVNRLPANPEHLFTAVVDKAERNDTERNHSATHLLHAALKNVLGGHVQQKGSLVTATHLRFDFAHFSKMTPEELQRVETEVNERIRENISLKEERHVPYQEALERGVTALFGEKYGDYVRVITFDENYSRELCGGTHVQATGRIGFFKITSESAVAAGVRRIEAITGRQAENFVREQLEVVSRFKELLNNPKDFVTTLQTVLQENSQLKKEVEKTMLEKAVSFKKDLLAKVQAINGVHFIAEKVPLPNAEAVKSLAFSLKAAVDHLFLVLTADFDGKPGITVMIADELVKGKNLHAGNIVKELAKEIQGGGGGQPFFATAGGKDSSGLDRVLEKARNYIV